MWSRIVNADRPGWDADRQVHMRHQCPCARKHPFDLHGRSSVCRWPPCGCATDARTAMSIRALRPWTSDGALRDASIGIGEGWDVHAPPNLPAGVAPSPSIPAGKAIQPLLSRKLVLLVPPFSGRHRLGPADARSRLRRASLSDLDRLPRSGPLCGHPHLVQFLGGFPAHLTGREFTPCGHGMASQGWTLLTRQERALPVILQETSLDSGIRQQGPWSASTTLCND